MNDEIGICPIRETLSAKESVASLLRSLRKTDVPPFGGRGSMKSESAPPLVLPYHQSAKACVLVTRAPPLAAFVKFMSFQGQPWQMHVQMQPP
jgi:hypothetical protein